MSDPASSEAMPDASGADASALASRFGLDADSARLRAALTHRSAVESLALSNERLEFLGDALLAGIVAGRLFLELPADCDEDTLTQARAAIVRNETLADAARMLGLPELVHVGAGERNARKHYGDGILADAYEALVAAIWLDLGADAAGAFVGETLADAFTAVNAAPPGRHPKSRLQETLQATGRGLPLYIVLAETAPPQTFFVIEVRTARGETLGRGEGVSKSEAERLAAVAALANLDQPVASDGLSGAAI